VSKRGLPTGVQMRHDAHYVDLISTSSRAIGKTIPIEQIEPNPEQPRSEFGDLSELTASIKEKGVLEPLLVKPLKDAGRWMIIAGERRWRASKLAGLNEVPCIEMDVDEQGIAEIALIENLQRKDLNVWEEADGLAALQQKFGYTQEQIAQKISKSRTTVTELLTIAGLPDDIREKCHSAKINSKSTLLEIARQFDETAMHAYLDDLTAGRTQKAPRTAKQKTATERNESATSTVESLFPSDADYVFEDDEVRIEFKFKSGKKAGRVDLLRVIKHAFDQVKSSG
jgi:ParB family transcriptional regulator, chromosome partitioning protein